MKIRQKLLFTTLILFSTFLLSLISVPRVSAATITVTSNGNSGEGTLRQALIDSSDGDTIEFSLNEGSETITLSSNLTASWGKSITIDGDNTDGSGTDITVQVATPSVSTYPVIEITCGTGKTATLKNLTLRGGDATTGSGGTVFMYSSGASLVLENCTVKDGRGRMGAGMWANDFDSLTIDGCTFEDNDADEDGSGARIDGFTGTVTITNSVFKDNNAVSTDGNYYGGGIYFYNNSAEGTVIIDKTTFSGNSVWNDGAGIYAKNIGSITITNSTFTENTNGSGWGNGGGLYAYNVPTLKVTNSTFTGNTAKYFGGAIYIGGSGTTATLTNVTTTNNSSSFYDYDGLYLSSATLYIKNSILADHAGYDFYNSNGTIIDNGYNIVEVSSNYTWSGTGDITGDQSNLNISRTLADNSSVFGTQTLALSSGSVAINAGNSSSNNGVSITTRDQRGLYRTDTVDIGAFEYEASITPYYTLSYTAGSGGSITGTTSQSVVSGGAGTAVNAVSSTGYHFVNWSDGSSSNPRTDNNVTEDISVTANFAIDSYTVTFKDYDDSTLKSETVNYGSSATAPTEPTRTGYTFTGWDVAYDNIISNLSVTAEYSINTFTLSYSAGDNGSITGTTSQTVNYNSNGSEVTAIPDSNYAFVKWSDESVENPRTDLNVTENVSVTATFEIIDSDAPTKSEFKINNGDNYTNSTNVTLTIEATDTQNDVSQMMISSTPNFTGASWETYATTKDWTFLEGDEVKNVYIKFKDAVGNESLIYSDSIILDTKTELVLSAEIEDTDDPEFSSIAEGRRETNKQRPIFSGTGEVGATVTITINSDPITGTTTVGEDGTWEWWPEVDIPIGEHDVTIVLTDSAGNTQQTEFVLGVVLGTSDSLGQTGINLIIPVILSLTIVISSSVMLFKNDKKFIK